MSRRTIHRLGISTVFAVAALLWSQRNNPVSEALPSPFVAEAHAGLVPGPPVRHVFVLVNRFRFDDAFTDAMDFVVIRDTVTETDYLVTRLGGICPIER